MRILVTPTFERAVKKLHKQRKSALDGAVPAIANQPDVGENKVGDLAGVLVYKFRMGTLVCPLAYRVLDENKVKLLMVGPHENFYRGLKRTEH
jgi:mRNA interferase RelE/StbE